MNSEFTKLGFAKTFLAPALLIFLVPALSLIFFYHAQSRFDADARQSVLRDIRADAKLSADERAQAIEFFTKTPISTLMTDPQIAAQVDSTARFYYATFRWMIRLSALSLIAGVVVFALAGVCVGASMHSQFTQYMSLLIGWQVLRIYGALQTAVIGVLIVALSFWVTALWFNFYAVKLIVVAGLFAFAGVLAVIVAIFQNPKSDAVVEGTVLPKDKDLALWKELQAICDKVGTKTPDQIIAGIDDNFFVTEQPIIVEGKKYHGRTLFVSLALLKQLHASEAAAVLAHEMAHFSGNDTLYSKRISPLLMRYEAYLQSLHGGMITMPVFYFMLCFRVLFELSLSKLRREREFRADAIAAATVSPRDIAGGLLRVSAYSQFRARVQGELFDHEQALEAADVSQRIERGFPAYAVAFTADPTIGGLETAHPFDSHPPLAQRLRALGFDLQSPETKSLLAVMGDGGWHDNIPDADQLERAQWQAFEEQFRKYHEQTLAYRFLPANDQERAIVEKDFPLWQVDGKDGLLTLDYEKVQHAPWPDAIYYREITNCQMTEHGVLQIHYTRQGKHMKSIKTRRFTGTGEQRIADAFARYYGRYLAAAEYQKMYKQQKQD